MQKIKLIGISTYARIGFGDEKKKKTKIEIDVELSYDFKDTVIKDDPSLDYRFICDSVNSVVEKNYNTIEKICYEIWWSLKEEFNPEYLKVKVRKKNPPLKIKTFYAEAEIEG